jgi:A/G-specific adenine glycosylase
VCPVAGDCAAKRLGIAAALPTPRKKPPRPERSVTVLVVQSPSGETLLERRPASGIWGGLLSFPEIDDGETPSDWCRRHLGVGLAEKQELKSVQHGFTHFVLTLSPVRLKLSGDAAVTMEGDRWLWYQSSEPLPGGVAAPIEKMLREITQPGQDDTVAI